MSKTLIIGASGQIGNIITQTMAQTNESARALVRDKSKLSHITGKQLEVIEMDLEGDFSAAFEGIDRVIFTAGSGAQTGPDKTLLIDLWAAKKAVDYAKDAQVKQFILVSSIGADDPDALESNIKPYLVAKHMADDYLIKSGIPFTIVRPGPLTNDKSQGKITIKRPDSRAEMATPRADVAKAVMFILSKDNLDGKVFELFNGTYDFDNVLVPSA